MLISLNVTYKIHGGSLATFPRKGVLSLQDTGWIKLHRSLLENPVVCKDGDHMAVWIYLLLSVTHQERDVIFKGERVTLKPGQQIFGRKSIATCIHISESKVQRILKTLESEQQIEQQNSSKNRLISILNWDKYQDSEQQIEQQLNNKRTTTEQQLNTNKNERKKECKNNVKDICASVPVDNPVDNLSEQATRIYDSYIPNKKRRPDITKRRIKALIKSHGADKVMQAVERYKASVQHTEPQFIKHSDGFFQEDYIGTYLDDSYRAPVHGKGKAVSAFTDYEQRSVDYNALEKSLLGWGNES